MKLLEKLFLIAIGMFMISTPLSGQTALLVPPKITDTTLSNGLRVIIVEKPNSPVVSITTAYKVGSRYEKKGKTGMAHLFEHLMFEGSPNVPSGEYDRWCTLAGGSNNAYTTHDFTVYYITLPAPQLQLGLWLESDRMLGLALSDEDLRNQQDVVLEEINENVENQPYGSFPAAIASLAFTPTAGYGHDIYGLPKDVDKVTKKDVQEFFNDYYRTDNAVLAICGNVNPQTALPLIEQYFGTVPAPSTPLPKIEQLKDTDLKSGSTQIEDNIPFDGLYMTYHTPGSLNRRAVLIGEVVASILSDGMSSRLKKSLQYEQQLVSEVGAYMDERELSSLFTLYASARDNSIQANELEAAISVQLAQLAEQGCSAEEVAKAKNKLGTRFAAYFDKAGNMGDEVARHTLLYGSPESLFRVLDEIETISTDDVLNYVRTYLVKERCSKIYYMPKE